MRFDPSDYPHGARCEACTGLLETGDELRYAPAGTLAGIEAVGLVHAHCSDAARSVGGLLLLADGTVEAARR